MKEFLPFRFDTTNQCLWRNHDTGEYERVLLAPKAFGSIWWCTLTDWWSGGISNPLEVIEQITYLLFLRRLDELQTLEDQKARTLKMPIDRRIFPESSDAKGRPYAASAGHDLKILRPASFTT